MLDKSSNAFFVGGWMLDEFRGGEMLDFGGRPKF